MPENIVIDIDITTVRRAVSLGAYDKGIACAQRRAVRGITWVSADAKLRGTVRGDNGRDYYAGARFGVRDGQPARFVESRCSCEAGGCCRHVVALILAVLPAATKPAAEHRGPASWQQPPISPPPMSPSAQAAGSSKSLAIEPRLTVVPGRAPRLEARIVERDEDNVCWVPSSLAWGTLETAGRSGRYVERQVDLLVDLLQLWQDSEGRKVHRFQQLINLSALESPRLWDLLDEAAAAGLPLVYEGTGGTLPTYQEGRFHLDVIRHPAGGYRITSVVRSGDQAAAVPVAFIGAEQQVLGAVCVDRRRAAAGEPDNSRFRLVRLVRPVPPQLQKRALDDKSWEIRADEECAFRTQHYPRLRQDTDLTSSDGSFVPPVISRPELVLSLSPGPGSELGLSWGWGYQIDDWRLRAEFLPGRPDEDYRSLPAEQELLRRLDLPVKRYQLGFPGPSAGSAPVLTPHKRLTGKHTTRFVNEFLPLLACRAGVRIEVMGDPAPSQAAESAQRATAATDEVAGQDWLDLNLQIIVAGHPVQLRDVFLALNCGDRYLPLPDGTYLALDRPELRALAGYIKEARALNPRPTSSNRFVDDHWNELAALGVPEEQALAWRERIQRLSSHPDIPPAERPAGLIGELHPHQQRGFDWLVFLWEHQLGGILAGDMGLGKTLQCLALISHLRQRDRTRPPVLVVAPRSVLATWMDQIEKFTSGLSVAFVTKTAARLGEPLSALVADADVVVTTYRLLHLDFDAYQKLDWSVLLLDEAQQVKNLQSKIYGHVRQVRAEVKIAVTGTPLENNLMELWSLLSITAPGLFPRPDQFFTDYAHPIEDADDQEQLARLRRLISPLVLRRQKASAAAYLPDKTENVLEVELDKRHYEVYQTWLQRERLKVLGEDGTALVNRFTILRSLTLLRQLCLHPGLIDEAYADLPSAKIEALISQLLELTSANHQALVFSQFTRFLGKVRARLEAEGLAYCYLDGTTHDRRGVVAKFQAGAAPVFLVSLKAGGIGLNLTKADHCFLLDPWWNPAIEAQAVDRIHRMGQTRAVNVYRLISLDTVEEKVRMLQARKAQLFSSVMDNRGGDSATFDADDIRSLFS